MLNIPRELAYSAEIENVVKVGGEIESDYTRAVSVDGCSRPGIWLTTMASIWASAQDWNSPSLLGATMSTTGVSSPVCLVSHNFCCLEMFVNESSDFTAAIDVGGQKSREEGKLYIEHAVSLFKPRQDARYEVERSVSTCVRCM